MLPFVENDVVLTVTYYFAQVFIILVSAYCAILFWIVYRHEQQLRTAWRASGFFMLALAASVNIFTPTQPGFEIVSALLGAVGFFCIYKGVRAELTLSHLRSLLAFTPIPISLVISVTTGAVFIAHVAAAISIATTIRLQIKRLRNEQDGPLTFRQNAYPLIGYGCLFVYTLLLATYPFLTDIVWLPNAMLMLAMLGFLFLSFWSWIFIRVRPTLRTSWLVLANGTAVLSVLAFLLSSFVVFGLRELFQQISVRLFR